MSLPERQLAISKIPDKLEVLPRPKLWDIKAVELYTKWRPILPSWARDLTCPKPSDAVLQKVKLSRSVKTKEHTQKRKLEAIENWNVNNYK